MAKVQAQSIEPNIADLANGWLKLYKLPYKLEQECVNAEIDKALSDYYSKNGGTGANRPDAKILLQEKNLNFFPILIEYKGYKDKLVKLDAGGQVENRTSKNEPNFKNINSYAVNGAVHYANALLHHTSYTDIIAIGMTGNKDETGKIQHTIGVYYVSKSNLGAGQKVGEYTDFSFLAPKNFDSFIDKVKTLQLTPEELDKLKEQREKEIDQSLVKLNNDIYQNEKGLGENDRVYLVAASIIATLGIPGKVAPLEKSDLKSSTEIGNKDGDIIVRKIKAFLDNKEIPVEKKNLILRTLENTLTTENINKVENGESQLKRVFTKIVDDLGIYYKIGLTTDFTGKLFNEMYGWLGFSQDKLNDVVLTPSYIANLLVKLARVNKDSYVWDFATGSAGLLVSAMNEMLNDAKHNIKSPQELTQKEIKIKTEQLLGIELLSSVYMLAILNMILMGDGSSNILNIDSIKDFDGKYGFGNTNNKFPADAFILNPPYSALGNGMNFVEKALGMMSKGYAAIIIQNSAGSGRAKDYCKRVLEKHTLLASIKMPVDIFIGKSSVQTNVYVFKVNEKHHKDEIVKFIDFSNDGYSRANRKKGSNNLKDTDFAKERYDEIVNLVRFGKSKLKIFTEKEYYEGNIDPKNGSDWNKSAPIDIKPALQDFEKTINGYLAWEVSSLLKEYNKTDKISEKENPVTKANLNSVEWSEFKIEDVLQWQPQKEIDPLKLDNLKDETEKFYPFYGQSTIDNGIISFNQLSKNVLNNVLGKPTILIHSNNQNIVYLETPFYLKDGHGATTVLQCDKLNRINQMFIIASIEKVIKSKYSYNNKATKIELKNTFISLPVKNKKIDFEFMEKVIIALEQERIKKIEDYLIQIKQQPEKALGHNKGFAKKGQKC